MNVDSIAPSYLGAICFSAVVFGALFGAWKRDLAAGLTGFWAAFLMLLFAWDIERLLYLIAKVKP